MRFNVELSDESLLDLNESREYYSESSSSLLKKFDDEVLNTIQQLAVNPQHFQKRYKNIKITFTKTFPFGIHYLVEGNTINIQRILH